MTTVRLSAFVAVLALCVLRLNPATAAADTSSAADTPATGALSADARAAGIPLAEIAGAELPKPRPAQRLDDAPNLRRHYERAIDLIEEGQPGRACDELDQALRTATGDYFELYYGMALARFRLDRLGDARASAEQALLFLPDDPDLHVLLGRIYQRLERWPQAIQHYRSATLAGPRALHNPRVTAAWFELAALLEQEGYLRAAAEAYAEFDRKVWDTHPEHRDDPEVRPVLQAGPRTAIERQVALLRRLNHTDDVVRAVRAAVESRPEDPALARMYARALLEAGQADAALSFCQSWSPREPRAAEASPLAALALEAARSAGKLDAWITDVVAQLSEANELGEAFALARRLERAGDLEQADRLWDACRLRQPEAAEAAWAVATIRLRRGAADAGLPVLAEFIRRNPKSVELRPARLAAWLEPAAQFAGFEALRAEWLARPNELDFADEFALGLGALAAGRLDLAGEHLKSAVQKRSEAALPMIVWSHALSRAYRWAEAEEQARAALAIAPSSGAASFALALALAGADQDKAAAAAFVDALRDSCAGGEHALAYGRHLRRMGDMLGAQRYFQEALALDPTEGGALEELIDSYLAGRKIEIAREQLRLAEESDVPEDSLRRARTTLAFSGRLFQAEHVGELQRQFTDFPEDGATGLRLATALYLNQRYDEALAALERVRALRTHDDENTLYLRANIQARRLEFDDAVNALEEVVRRYPQRLSAMASLADMLLSDFRLEAARALVRRMLTVRGEVPGLRDSLLRLLFLSYREFRDHAGALRCLDEWAAAGGDEEVLERARVEVLLSAERYEEALRLAEEREQAAAADRAGSPAHADALAVLVAAALEAEEPQRAEGPLRAWLSQNPEDLNMAKLLTRVFVAQRRGAEALDALRGVRPRQSSDALELYFLRARARALHDVDGAAQELDELLTEGYVLANPIYTAQVREWLVSLLIEARAFEAARQRCEQWLSALPASADEAERSALRELLRNILRYMGEEIAASRISEELLEQNPRSDELCNDLGYTWADAGLHLSRSLELIRFAVGQRPRNAAYLDSLGWVYYKLGRIDEAREFLWRSAQLTEGQDPVVYDHLGDAEHRRGQPEAARQAWREGLRLAEKAQRTGFPQVPPIEDTIANLRAKLAALDAGTRPPLAAAGDELKQPAATPGAE